MLLECRHVSVNLFSRPAGPDDVVAALVEVMRRHGWSTGAFIGHSCALLPLLPALHAASSGISHCLHPARLLPLLAGVCC